MVRCDVAVHAARYWCAIAVRQGRAGSDSRNRIAARDEHILLAVVVIAGGLLRAGFDMLDGAAILIFSDRKALAGEVDQHVTVGAALRIALEAYAAENLPALRRFRLAGAAIARTFCVAAQAPHAGIQFVDAGGADPVTL